jgi:hypothetical protein
LVVRNLSNVCSLSLLLSAVNKIVFPWNMSIIKVKLLQDTVYIFLSLLTFIFAAPQITALHAG